MIIRNNTANGLKGQKHIAQGNALGADGSSNFRPEGAKAFNNNAFASSWRGKMCARATRGVALGYVLFGFAFVRHVSFNCIDAACRVSTWIMPAPRRS